MKNKIEAIKKQIIPCNKFNLITINDIQERAFSYFLFIDKTNLISYNIIVISTGE